ncbi:hypothetical protein FPH17_02725 [Corynebacterium godavarianum]|uniref:Uncharacterized protein n=1 Tax=Corynebacterium godavarianum TaxID=2054421 RepID=A0ABY3E6A6_9CORY|nr:hypothetical protein [Corynebacterium godavarianum]MBL7285820.1 hypothetical protein [Corynebacterium godavarianum]TSJ75353.1 hypothetical protein FPH17_02725 [Corynebacterium godavarianum]
MEKGFAKAVGSKSKGFTPYYLTSGKLQDIERGEIEIIGRNGDGSVEVRRSKGLKTVMEGVRKFVCEALI